MSENREWNSSDEESEDEPQFRQFSQQLKHAPAGDKGLWSILDSVARQPSRPEQHLRKAPVAPESLNSAPAPLPPVFEPPLQPAPVSPQPSSTDIGASGFGHLFRRQPEETPVAPVEGTSLKALFKRISK